MVIDERVRKKVLDAKLRSGINWGHEYQGMKEEEMRVGVERDRMRKERGGSTRKRK